jgi:hypothetical protein
MRMEVINFSSDFWSEWQDLNLRPPRPERVLSPTALLWLLFRQCLLHNLEATSSSVPDNGQDELAINADSFALCGGNLGYGL